MQIKNPDSKIQNDLFRIPNSSIFILLNSAGLFNQGAYPPSLHPVFLCFIPSMNLRMAKFLDFQDRYGLLKMV